MGGVREREEWVWRTVEGMKTCLFVVRSTMAGSALPDGGRLIGFSFSVSKDTGSRHEGVQEGWV